MQLEVVVPSRRYYLLVAASDLTRNLVNCRLLTDRLLPYTTWCLQCAVKNLPHLQPSDCVLYLAPALDSTPHNIGFPRTLLTVFFCLCIRAPSCQVSTSSGVVGICLSSLGTTPSAGASQLPAVRSPHHLQWLECVSQVLVQPLDSMLHRPCDELGLSQTVLPLLVRPSLRLSEVWFS